MKSIWSVAVVLFAVATVGCSSGESPTPDGVGTYTLVKVNGSNVPVITLQNASITQEITAGQLTLSADGTFTETRTGRVTLPGGTPSTITSTQSGTWVENQGKIDFVALGAQGNQLSTFSGTWTLEHITYTSAGTTFDYSVIEHI